MTELQRILNALRAVGTGQMGTAPSEAERAANLVGIEELNAPENAFQGEVTQTTDTASLPVNAPLTQAEYRVNPLTDPEGIRRLIEAQMRPAQAEQLLSDQKAGYEADTTGSHEAVRARRELERRAREAAALGL